jgi:hypothetical protein
MAVCGRAHDPTRERGRIGKRAAALARQDWGFEFASRRNSRRSRRGRPNLTALISSAIQRDSDGAKRRELCVLR